MLEAKLTFDERFEFAIHFLVSNQTLQEFEEGLMNAVEGTSRIREVWAENLAEEMSYIRAAIDEYPFVAMVRFPSRSAGP